MFIAFFVANVPDRCGAFYSDLCLAREMRSRGHSVILINCDRANRNFQGGEYEGFRWKPYVSAGRELDQTHLWVSPHYPYGTAVRRLNQGYKRPIIFTLHFAGAKHIFDEARSVQWSETFWYVNSEIPRLLLGNRFPSFVAHHELQTPFMDAAMARLTDEPRDEYITLVNANMNKGLAIFLKIAKALPEKKFLAIRSYYHPPTDPNLEVPPNIVWEDFTRDIKSIYRRTRIMLVPSAYESFCVVAAESMLNGIPVLYSKPSGQSPEYGMVGSTEGMYAWIHPEGLACTRSNIDEWVEAIRSLDDPEVYQARSDASREKAETLFDTAKAAADYALSFAANHSVRTNTQFTIQNAAPKTEVAAGPTLAQLTQRPSQPVGWRGGKLSFARR